MKQEKKAKILSFQCYFGFPKNLREGIFIIYNQREGVFKQNFNFFGRLAAIFYTHLQSIKERMKDGRKWQSPKTLQLTDEMN